MTDIAITAALMFGFALVCVIAVVYLLSKRQIHVVQNNSNSTSVTTTERTDSSTGGAGRVERSLIKWTFIVIVAGLVIATLANAVATSFPAQRASVGNPSAIVATPAPIPTVAAQPISSPVSAANGGGREGVVSTNPLTIIIPILAGAAASIWGHIIISVIKINRARRAASPAKREAQLESILPDAVNQL